MGSQAPITSTFSSSQAKTEPSPKPESRKPALVLAQESPVTCTSNDKENVVPPFQQQDTFTSVADTLETVDESDKVTDFHQLTQTLTKVKLLVRAETGTGHAKIR